MRSHPQNTQPFLILRLFISISLILALHSPTQAYPQDSSNELKTDDLKLHWGGFIDTFYTYDLNHLKTSNRNPSGYTFTSQAARHNEFNLNLGYLEVTAQTSRTRGRFALQSGTSVPIGYSSLKGRESTALNSIQEAFVGYQLSPQIWVDAGIFFSHIGFESWISKNNWTYTRSIVSDQVPYFQTGIKLSYDTQSSWAFQFMLLNGWSNVLNYNQNKAIGMHIDYRLSPQVTLTYNNFYGLVLHQKPRLYQEAYATLQITDEWSMIVSAELGLQKTSDTHWAKWGSLELITQYQLTPHFALAYRLETFRDRGQITETTQTRNGYTLSSSSIGFNSQLTPQLLWRAELRGYLAADPLFRGRNEASNRDAAMTTSLSLSI